MSEPADGIFAVNVKHTGDAEPAEDKADAPADVAELEWVQVHAEIAVASRVAITC